MDAMQIILSRGLPKTGQFDFFYSDDDGDIEAGWWLGKPLAANKERFILKTIGGDAIVIDRATGLLWARDGNEAGCDNAGTRNFSDAITFANGLDFAGFVDWRLPNINELRSIQDFGRSSAPTIWSVFTNTYNGDYWSSTTFDLGDTNGFTVSFDSGVSTFSAKSIARKLRCVRGGL